MYRVHVEIDTIRSATRRTSHNEGDDDVTRYERFN